MSEAIPEDPEALVWDVVVIGTGAGGATAGYALARLGQSVLFLERGKLLDHDPTVIKGQPFVGNGVDALRYGWWPEPIYRQNGGTDVAEQLTIGCGTGGSTALFGKVMDRLRPEDFTPRRFFRTNTDTSLPEAWPISYEELEPFYAQAEQLYGVTGSADPLSSKGGGIAQPPPPSKKELAVSDALVDCGLHPYRVHYAQPRVPDCRGCPAMLCPRECRNDALTTCLRPALDQHGAKILGECRVISLEESARAVRRAICEWNGRRIAVRGRVFVLAANAFSTPTILQRSANERFPDGLANSSGLVGRNLMLHVSDFLLLRLKRPRQRFGTRMSHGVSLNDFYIRDGLKMGNVHAHPVTVAREETLAFMKRHMRRLNRLPSPALSLMASIGSLLNRTATVFSTVVEDLPYVHNRVLARPGALDRANYEYYYPDELRLRSWTLYNGFKKAVSSRFSLRALRPVGMLNFTHVCGTCRFGDDPASSVLDRNNRAHDLDNLYVLDASFFPSSGGINPSLTIVANSLRVSHELARRL